jgi:hypothetical protein
LKTSLPRHWSASLRLEAPEIYNRHRTLCNGSNRLETLMELTEDELALVRDKLAVLKIEHRDLDDVIEHLSHDQKLDELQMQRLKKRKLLLKDQISALERQLVPDISA